MRLIDADALMQQTYTFYPNGKTMTLAVGMVRVWVKDAQTVDAAPVVHGRWMKKSGQGIFYCSECGLPSMHNWPYCERCGAKMDGGETDGTNF